jgi:DNA-binding NarL/FixJ family response regulator
MSKIRIAIIDDHNLVRRGFCLLLNKIEDIDIVLETDDINKVIELVEAHELDILFVDISIKNQNGIDFIPKLKKIDKDLKYIMLTMHTDTEYVIRSMKSGANAYLLKDVEPDELERAIRNVYEKGKYINPFVSEIILDNITKPKYTGNISPREKEVLECVVQGMSTKLIAEKLNISTRTVETHRIKMMKKINAINTAELVKKAIEYKLIN